MAAARPEYALAMKRPESLVFCALVGAALTTYAAKTGLIKFIMPQKGKIIGVRLAINQKGGTFSTALMDILAGGVSIFTAGFDVATAVAGTPLDKEVADLSATGLAAIAANTEMAVNTTESGGTSPTWADVVLMLDYIPV